MPTDNTYLPLDDVLNFDVAEQPATKVAETEAKILKLKKEFEFDPQLSIASEMELERHREVEEIRRKAAQNQKTTEFLNSSDDRARVAVDDIDGLNSVADGLKNINGVPQLSVGAMESNIVDINANKFGGVFKSMAQQVNQNNDLRRVQQDNSALGQIKKFDSTKKPESTIEPIQDRGNKYWNAVKRGSASIIQLGSLLYDGGYEAFERGADMVTGWDVNGHVPYKTNKVFNAMQSLKQGEYAQSSQLNNLMVGSELAAKDAEANGENPLVASLSYLAKNGELGDAGEVVAEFVPSLVIGGGLGGMAERGAVSLVDRYVANRIGQSVAKNSIINPTRLAAVQVAVPKAVQGAVIAGSSDFVGSFAPEVEAQIEAGYKESDAVARALTKSLAQAGVSAVGGSLLPVRVGGDLSTVATQSVVQGLFGYGSAAAGAASIGEDLSATEGALNILLGAVTALPEVVMVGSTSIRKSDIQQGINDAIVERAIASTYQKQEEQETRAVYSGAVIRNLIDRVKKTKTQERAPEIIRDFIKTMQADPDATKEVYIDSEKFNQLASEYNIDVDSLFELSPELAREYERSNDVDGLIRIPLDELLTTFSTISNEDYLNAFADSIRVNPEALTAGEAKAEFAKTSEDFQGDVQQIKAEFNAEMKKVEDANSIANVIAEDLKNVAGFSADYNNNAKALVTAFYESLAAKTGVSARELYEAMPLRVVATDEQAQAIMRGDVDAFNQLYPDYLNDDLRELSDFYKSDDDFQFENGEKIDEIQNRIIDKLVNDDDFNGMFIKTNEGFASLSKSSKVEGQWQATYFDSEYNPISDGGVYDKKTAITDFIESINPIEIENKTNVAEQTKQEFQDSLKEKYSIDLGLTESKYNNQLVIEKIIVPDDQRGTGVGTNAMNEIISYADNNGKVLTLTPSSDFGGNKKRLVEFYKRFGFVENKGKNKDYEISEAMYRPLQKVESFNQSLDQAIDAEIASLNDPQVELRKIYGYRDSHLAPDAESGVSGSQIAEVYPELNNRDFTKNYGDGFKYDAKTVKIIREMQKNPDADVTIYRTVPKDIDVNSINFGDWIALTKDYADEHGKARFDGQYKIIEQVVKASDLYTDGNSIHEWGYSPKDSDIYKARLELSEQLKKLNDRLDQGIFNSTVSKKAVLGDKAELKNNPAIAKMFLDSKGIEPKIITNKSEVSDSVASLLPELNALEYNSDITKNPDLLDRAFNALYLDKHKNVLSDPEASDFEKRQAERKISRFSDADADTKYNLINNEVAKVKGSKSDGSVNESLTRSSAIEQAKLFNSEYDDFVDNVLKQLGLDYYNQKNADQIRGQIQFRKDKSGAVIILGKNANFSTFVHELGHHFLEMSMAFAGRPDAPEQLKADMIKVMDWSKQGKNIEDWKQLTPEQKTEVHEKFAETFEQYLFTGKAPSNELRKVFAKFRTFMAAVYRNIEKFLGIQTRAELNPEIRDVMDRMLATQDAIEQVQRQRNLEFIIAQEDAMRMGISPKEYLELVEAHNEATEQAVNELEQKTISDLARYRNIRAKNMKAFSEQQKRVRQQVREEAAKEVAQIPVYQAIAFLRQPVERPEKVKRDPNVVDPKVDTLLEAIAKMGGIDAKEIESTWGTDKPESYKVNVGRVKKVARKDGLSIETVAERLAEDGYLSVDDHGKFDTRELEDLFSDSLIGGKYYSRQADPDLFAMGDDYGPAMDGIEEFPDNGKLNLEWLKAKYGEDSEIFKAVGKTGQYGLAMKDGLDPELVATNFGYESADAMIQDMANAPPPKDVIEERTNELIKAQYSDLFDEKEVELAIDEAVHNEIRGMMLARELTAITKLEGRWSELNAQAKEVARDKINRSLITEIRPHVFSTAELKHSKNYSKAIKSGDTMGAVRAKRLQLINFHATKQAYEANRYVDKLFDLVKKINGSDERLAKNRDFNLVALARWVAGQYGLIENDASYSEHIKNLKQYDPLAAMQIADLVYVQEDGVSELALPLKNYQEMTFEEFQTLDNIIRQIWHRSKESQKIEVGEKKVEFTQVVDALVTQTQKKPLKARNESFFGYVPKDSKSFNPQRALQSLTRAEQLFTWLDDGKANGFYHQYVFNPMQDSLAAYRKEQRVMMQGIVDIYSKFDPKPGKIDASMLGGKKTTFESKHELLHAILHTGNESNKKRLVLGYEWGEVLPDGSVDYTNWNAFIEKMFDDGVITKTDMDAIQEIWNLFDKYKGQAQEVHKKINGLYFKELPKTPINTPFGVYEGGYIPADYDRLQSVEAEQRGKANDASTQKDQFFVAGATTGANFTKSRVENYNGDVMVLDLTQLPMHLDRELRYIHLEQNLRQASKIFRNRDVMKSVEGAAPFSMDAVISDWLNAVANQRVSKASDYPTWDRFLERLKQNSGIVLMSGNIKNAVETLTSLPMVMTAVPKRELASSAAKYFTDAFSRESMVKHVRELSPFMDTHLDRVANEMRYKMERIVANPGNIKKTSDFLRQNAYVVQQVIQAPLEAISWNAAFNDALNRGVSKADAIYHADGVVRMYLSDMSPEGMSKIERSNSMMRIMLMFYGWFNMVHNTWAMKNKMVSEDASLSGLQKMGKYASIYTMMIAMPAMLSKALTLSFNGDLFDNEDSEDVADDLVNIVVKSQAEMVFGMMPFARDIINPIYRTTFDATIYSDRYNISPVQSMVENMVKTGKRVGDLAVEGETDASALTKGMLQSATFATGVPFTIVQRPATYAADVLIDEDQEPENIPDAIRGTLNGR